MKKQILILGTGLIWAFAAIAQNDIDAMRYSQLTFGGTARFASMAGSMGALGGDISTLSTNPAGIAVFRKSEFTITPSLVSQNTLSTYNGSTSSDGKLNFNLSNIGLVGAWDLSNRTNTGWKTFDFGFAYNRINSFQTRTSVSGYNTSSSLLDTYVGNANGHTSADFDAFSTNLAYQTYLINPTLNDSTKYNHVLPYYGEQQMKSTITSGSMGETDLSFGGNYKDKVLVGGTIGFVSVKYSEQSVYQEVDSKDSIPNFKSFSYSQNVTTRGNGVNVKIGVIVKPTNWLRVGMAVHTPTTITLHDSYNNDMKSDLETATYEQASPQGAFDYSIVTPFRAIGSLGFIINKNALLNAEYEYVNYTDAQLHSSPDVFADVNQTIRAKYGATGNLRVGGEVRFDPISFRLGYAMYGSPFNSGQSSNSPISSYTAGVGFRENNYFLDFAYVFTKYTQYNYLYDPTGIALNPVKNDNKISSFMLTLGFKF